MQLNDPDLAAVFKHMPGNHVLVLPDAPRFTIVAATDGYLGKTGMEWNALAGTGLLEWFVPGEGGNSQSDFQALAGWLQLAVTQKTEQQIARLRLPAAGERPAATDFYPATIKPVLTATDYLSHLIFSIGDAAVQTPKSSGGAISRIAASFQMFMEAPVAICIVNSTSYLVELVNDGMLDMLGRTQDIIGKRIETVLPEAREQGLVTILDHVLATGKSYHTKNFPATLLIDGQRITRYFDLIFKPFTPGINNHETTRIFCVAHNVTEQVEIQKKLEESEALLQERIAARTAELEQQKKFIGSLLDASTNGIYALQAIRDEKGKVTDFRYLFVNNYIAQVLQKAPEEIIGASMLELLPENWQNGFFELFCQILTTNQPVRDVTHFITKKIDCWYDFTIVPTGNDTVLASIHDITALRTASLQIEEQRNLLDKILKHSSNGISVSETIRDAEGKVADLRTVLANDAAAAYIGLSDEAFLSKTALEVDPNVFETPYGKAYLHTLETGTPSTLQYYIPTSDRWLELTISKMDDQRLIHNFTDITATKDAHLRLERTITDLKRANINLEEFAYAASHDMKEPVRKINIFSDRLRTELAGQLNPHQFQLFERLENASSRMGLLIDDLLAYSQTTNDVAPVEEVNLNKTLGLVLEDLELETEQKNAHITADPLPTVNGYRRQLQQLLQNLVSNALKYQKTGVAPVIHVGYRAVSGQDLQLPAEQANQLYHLITVQDNGIGFEPAEAERIFHVFTRLHGNAEYKGTGVGLSIARKVVENHKGRIWAEGSPGVGASFNVLLPLDML